MLGRNPTRNYFAGPHGRAKSGGRNSRSEQKGGNTMEIEIQSAMS
jgi:hypothetical protein